MQTQSQTRASKWFELRNAEFSMHPFHLDMRLNKRTMCLYYRYRTKFDRGTCMGHTCTPGTQPTQQQGLWAHLHANTRDKVAKAFSLTAAVAPENKQRLQLCFKIADLDLRLVLLRNRCLRSVAAEPHLVAVGAITHESKLCHVWPCAATPTQQSHMLCRTQDIQACVASAHDSQHTGH